MGLRELIRIHLESLEIIMGELRSAVPEAGGTDKWKSDTQLNRRLIHMQRLLKYHEVTATELVEQQRNLLSLVCNPSHNPIFKANGR